MSCDWNIRCVDCGQTHRFDDANHCVAEMRTFIAHAAAIAGLAPFMKAMKNDVKLQWYCGNLDAEWFADHLDHKLQPIDEYGRLDDQCHEYAKCSCCGDQKPCTLKGGHDGEHAP